MPSELYLHEDEWGMISLDPAETLAERRRVIGEAEAHGEAHAIAGVGWSKLYVAPSPSVTIAARGITIDALLAALGGAWVACDGVRSELIDYPGTPLTPFALHQPPLDASFENVVYGLCDGDRVDRLCITRCRPAMADTLRRLCTTFDLIICDLWWNEVIVPDEDRSVRALPRGRTRSERLTRMFERFVATKGNRACRQPVTHRVALVVLALQLGAHAWADTPVSRTSTRRRNSLAFCAGVGISFAKPAYAEWTYWLGAGGGVDRPAVGAREAVLGLRAGTGVDFNLVRWGAKHRYGGLHELRWGPWLGVETTLDDHVVEAGLSLDLGQTYHAQWGTVGLRFGVGTGLLDSVRRPTASVTLTYGVRSVPARYSEGGGCVVRGGTEISDPGEPVRRIAFASGVRLYATGRTDLDGHTMWLLGVELEPSFALPPYSLMRLGGSNPSH